MRLRLSASGLEHDLAFELTIPEGVGNPRPGSRKATMTVEERFKDSLSLDLAENEVRPILDLVENSKINPVGSSPMGLDGVTYTLTLSGINSRSTFEWWVEAGENWHALDRIAREIIVLAEKRSGRQFRLR